MNCELMLTMIPPHILGRTEGQTEVKQYTPSGRAGV